MQQKTYWSKEKRTDLFHIFRHQATGKLVSDWAEGAEDLVDRWLLSLEDDGLSLFVVVVAAVDVDVDVDVDDDDCDPGENGLSL